MVPRTENRTRRGRRTARGRTWSESSPRQSFVCVNGSIVGAHDGDCVSSSATNVPLSTARPSPWQKPGCSMQPPITFLKKAVKKTEENVLTNLKSASFAIRLFE